MKLDQEIKVGFKATLTKTVSEQDILDFARISGDSQPLHLDSTYAKATRFKARIAHGTILIGLISGVLGTKLVGSDKTVVFLGLSVRFVRPTYIGDTVTATCQVTKVREDKPIVTLAISCANQKGEVLLEGDATVLIDPMPFVPPSA